MPDDLTNSELYFLSQIRKGLKVIFDVGTNNDSIYLDEICDVHYFEPYIKPLIELSNKPRKNVNAYFNFFGLGNKEEHLKYYDNVGSFTDRSKGFSRTPSHYSGLELLVRRAEDYINEKNITSIDFVKIDVEGFELNVFKGFGDKLNIVKYIQFEYGSGVADNGYKMIDMINYLKQYGFRGFSYIDHWKNSGLIPITDYTDHWKWCNMVCYNSNLLTHSDTPFPNHNKDM